jgi:hypothetical protein
VVSVPAPAGLGQEVAAVHRHGVAVDDGPHALALDDEAEGMLGVAMFRRVLPRQQVLNRSPQRGSRKRAATEAGVGQRDRAALTTAPDWHQLPRPLSEREQVGPFPQVRQRPGSRVNRHQVADLGPQWHQ